MLGVPSGGRGAWRLVPVVLIATLFGTTRDAAGQRLSPPVRDPQHQFQRQVTSWTALKQRNVVMQRRDYSCGAAALATVVRYFWGDPASEETFLEVLPDVLTPEELADRIREGLTMTDLRRLAVHQGYSATIGRLTFNQLTEARVPLIVNLDVDGYRHFVVYRGTDGRYVYLADPLRGNVRVLIPEFVGQWQAGAALVVAKPGADLPDVSPLTVRSDEISLGWLNRQLIRRHATR